MGTGQQLLSIGALILLSLLILNINKSTNNRLTEMYSNSATIAATGIAESMIDEIQSKAFDENTVYKAVDKTTDLTSPNSLGPETGETNVHQFNDVDDYNNYTTKDTITNFGVFGVRVKVYYVVNMDPSVKSSISTFAKKVDVYVNNSSLTDTLEISNVVAY